MLQRLALALALFIFPMAAEACTGERNFAIMHAALPNPIPEGLFVADVEIEPGEKGAIYDAGLRARVTKVVAGPAVSDIILRWPDETSCDAWFANGRRGLIVGVVKGKSGKHLVVWPMRVTRADGFKLPADFKPEGEWAPEP